jgi:ATP-binding cassette subfamily F protein uup
VGRNGAGKSTLLRILAGQNQPDGGDRFLSPGARVVLLSQEPQITGSTILDYAIAGGAAVHEAEAELMLFGVEPTRATQGLSGGEARRIALARALAEQPDVLLLDEPTNHLDIFAIETLEQELRSRRMAMLIVSHDRAFLDRTTQRCFWLEDRRIWRLDKGFAAFQPWADKIAADQAETLRRLNKAIERETYWFHRSITAQRTRNEGRARALEDMRLQKMAIMKDLSRPLEMAIDTGGTSGKLVAEVKGLTKRWGDKVVVDGFSTRIVRGDRVAIVGPNGAGKTTLVKLMLGEIKPDAGTVRLGAALQITYLDQSRSELKDTDTLWDALTPLGGDSILVRGVSKHVAAYAKDFLFKESQLRQPVSTLSGGERNRLLLARALAKPANMLVLDEPTNDLDMETLDLLEDLLADYDGTLVLVSHDRDFIDRLATSTIALDGHGRAVETPGGWTDFKRQNPGFFDQGPPSSAPRSLPPKGAEEDAHAEVSILPPLGEVGRRPEGGFSSPQPQKVKLTYKDQRRLEEAERETHDLPAEITRLETVLADPDLYTRDPARFDATMKAIDAARLALEKAEEDWLELSERLEGR